MKSKLSIKVKDLKSIEMQMLRLGMSKTLLQRAADLSEPTVREILRSEGTLNITARTAHKFCKALDLEFDQVFEVV